MQSFSVLAWLLVIAVSGDGAKDSATNRQRVDLIELNHFVDQEGREVFRQLIFYDWSSTHRRYHVRAWRLVKDASQLPQRRWDPAIYQCTWHDDHQLRQVWSPAFRETWSQKDPERANREILPEDQRVPLWR
jgi:hypothetical protein